MLRPDEDEDADLVEEGGGRRRRRGTGGLHGEEEGAEIDQLLLDEAHLEKEHMEASPGSPFRLPPFLPHLLLMLAATMYLCARNPLHPPPKRPRSHPTTAASSSSSTTVTSMAAVSLTPLSLSARHPTYGAISEETRRMYGWDVIFEFGADVYITLTGAMPGSQYDWRFESADGEREVFYEGSTSGNNTVMARCPKAGSPLILQVVERHGDVGSRGGSSISSFRTYTTSNAVCKYVRREIRTLTDHDRQRYLDALNAFYRSPLEEGRALYGPDFVNAAWITACHNSKIWCLHQPSPFLVAHAAFVYWGESAMRMIDPTVTLPYWDHTIDSLTLGSRWAESPVFTDEWFGAVATDAHTNYTITKGRFGYMPVAVDLGSLYDRYRPGVDAFGHLNLGYTTNGAKYVTRSDEVCGIRSAITWSPPENLFRCYEYNHEWEDANECMYDLVHQQMHSHMCGTWHCAHNLSQVHEEYASTFSRDLLSYIAVAGKMLWQGPGASPPSSSASSSSPSPSASTPDDKAEKKRKKLGDYRHCDVPRWSKCTCSLDTEGMAMAELEDIMAADLETAMNAYPGQYFISPRGSDSNRYVFVSKGKMLGDEDNERLLRIAAKIWCHGAVDGTFAGMASINDPIFYTSHAFYDRIFHFVLTSPQLKETLNMTWGTNSTEHHCQGLEQADRSPFPRFFADKEDGEGYTMHELGDILHPRNVELPYVYDDIVYWGSIAWRPAGAVVEKGEGEDHEEHPSSSPGEEKGEGDAEAVELRTPVDDDRDIRHPQQP